MAAAPGPRVLARTHSTALSRPVNSVRPPNEARRRARPWASHCAYGDAPGRWPRAASINQPQSAVTSKPSKRWPHLYPSKVRASAHRLPVTVLLPAPSAFTFGINHNRFPSTSFAIRDIDDDLATASSLSRAGGIRNQFADGDRQSRRFCRAHARGCRPGNWLRGSHRIASHGSRPATDQNQTPPRAEHFRPHTSSSPLRRNCIARETSESGAPIARGTGSTGTGLRRGRWPRPPSHPKGRFACGGNLPPAVASFFGGIDGRCRRSTWLGESDPPARRAAQSMLTSWSPGRQGMPAHPGRCGPCGGGRLGRGREGRAGGGDASSAFNQAGSGSQP